jgi:hypothetical protein
MWSRLDPQLPDLLIMMPSAFICWDSFLASNRVSGSKLWNLEVNDLPFIMMWYSTPCFMGRKCPPEFTTSNNSLNRDLKGSRQREQNRLLVTSDCCGGGGIKMLRQLCVKNMYAAAYTASLRYQKKINSKNWRLYLSQFEVQR